MSSGMNSDNDIKHQKQLLSLGKSISCDNLKANSCIELADIRKLDSLLNQCESISCDNLLLYDDIYNYELCVANQRKYASTSAINNILPKNSIRRRAHKKVLGIRESDTKIIKFLDDKREAATYGKLTNCYDDKNEDDACNVTDDALDVLTAPSCFPHTSSNTMTSSCCNISTLQHEEHPPPHCSINCCDKTIQTSYIDLNNPLMDERSKCFCSSSKNISRCVKHPAMTSTHKKECDNKNEKRKQCSCRDYKSVNNTTATICETSLSTIPNNITIVASKRSMTHNQHHKKLLIPKKDKSDDKSSTSVGGKFNRLMKQKNTIIDDDEADYAANNLLNSENENRVININKCVEIIPISVNSLYSQPTTPRLGGTSMSLHHDADKSETQSQKSKRSKFSPSFISRKLTSRLNSSELEDGAGGAKESLLGRAKSAEKKLPEPVETVCIFLLCYCC
jgi:hypothetical protein